ncbi:MAG TPA: hypothetical protein VJB08_03295 [Candidatus Nanoarchaeia archaeon]|nr:hypothetical protein [Candidatus Nanoarchaeia archaeon]
MRDPEKRGEPFLKKLDRHRYWDQFWRGLTGIAVGATLIVYPVFSDWAFQTKIISVVSGIIVLVFFLWWTRRNYARM